MNAPSLVARLFGMVAPPPATQPQIKPPRIEPFAHAIPATTNIRARSSLTVDKIANTIASAETGDASLLLTLYRDVLISDDHLQGEFSKRLAAVLGDPIQVIPFRKGDAADEGAAAAVREMIARCENWNEALGHFLKSVLWPVTIGQKIFEAAPADSPLRYILKRIEPVDFEAIDLRARPPSETRGVWEGSVRLCTVNDDGSVNRYAPQPIDPDAYIVHRGNLLNIPDAWGGPFRSILFWWLLGNMDREWWGRFLEKFGTPFLHGKTDATNAQNISLLKSAFALASRLGGLVTDRETEVQIQQASVTGNVDAFERFHDYASRRISRLLVGQELSSSAASTGLGSGVANLQAQVREDIRQFDQAILAGTIRAQVLPQFLRYNAVPGRVPRLGWAGDATPAKRALASLLTSLGKAGLQPDVAALPTLSEKVGFNVRHKRIAKFEEVAHV